jgi:hypothetical protein
MPLRSTRGPGLLGKKLGDITLTQAFVAVVLLFTAGTLVQNKLREEVDPPSPEQLKSELQRALEQQLELCRSQNGALRAELRQLTDMTTLRVEEVQHRKASDSTALPVTSEKRLRITTRREKYTLHRVRPTTTSSTSETVTAILDNLRSPSAATSTPVKKGTLAPVKRDHPRTPGSKPRAAFVYLTTNRDRDLKDLRRSLGQAYSNFIQEFNYPVYIFHEGNLDRNLQDRIAIPWKGKLSIQFYVVDLKPPPGLDLKQFQAQARGWKQRPSLWGYNNMIRFWVKLFFEHPAALSLDYYMRLDTDSLINSRIHYDFFQRMKQRQYVYGFHSTVPDTKHFLVGLWTFTKQYVRSARITPAWAKGYEACRKAPLGLPSFRNNFEVGSLAFFRRPDVRKFIDAIDADGGIYRIRWGDATIRWLQMALFAKEAEIHGFCDWKYTHDGTTSGPTTCAASVRSRRRHRKSKPAAAEIGSADIPKKQSCSCTRLVDLPLDSHLD